MRHPEIFQCARGGVQAFLPVVTEEHRVIPADDLCRGQTHAAGAARDYRYRIHGWTVYGGWDRDTFRPECHLLRTRRDETGWPPCATITTWPARFIC
ncbi:hypothetical protein GCM10027535_20100 [Mycolicibacterium hippocampi]|uniref:Uncharacterized protein n=1 Tax=Mycolicibacterium hippocampi TaxID=659824 RepID=A0A7I9ZHI7_9MYCO|nr:hypothetical protein MHIP_07890 [Mycolicibacterium hippocampi]